MNVNSVSRRDFIKIGAVGGLSALSLRSHSAQGKKQITAESSPLAGKIRLAVVKSRIKALAFAGEALKNGADIVLFHEELVVGYVANLKELAESADGRPARPFSLCWRAAGPSLCLGAGLPLYGIYLVTPNSPTL
jgi:hypothetical protein